MGRAAAAALVATALAALLLVAVAGAAASPSPEAGGDVPVSSITRVLTSSSSPSGSLPPVTRSEVEGEGRGVGLPSASVGVKKETVVMSKEELKATEPERVEWKAHHIWTPDGRKPLEGSDISRAIGVAASTFAIAEVRAGATRMSLYYVDSKTGEAKPLRIAEFGNSTFCTPTGDSETIRGVSTDLDALVSMYQPNQRAQAAMQAVHSLYAKCKATVRTAITRTDREGRAVASSSDWGPLVLLRPRKGSRWTAVDTVRTWFNNVHIFFEGDGTIRREVVRIAADRQGTLEKEVWPYVRGADLNLRLSGGKRASYRTLTGPWLAYDAFLAARRWRDLHKLEGPVASVRVGEFTTDFAVRTGPTSVRAKRDDGDEEPPVEVDEGPAPSFLEVSAQAKGIVSLLHPRRTNPGTVYAKSFMGAGLHGMLVSVLEQLWLDHKANTTFTPGTVIDVPCLSRGVGIGRASIASPLMSQGETVCWTRGGQYTRDACNAMSLSRNLVTAVVRGRVEFVGTSNYTECRALVKNVLTRGKDQHLFPQRYRREFKRVISEDPDDAAPFTAKAREEVKHVVLQSVPAARLLRAMLKTPVRDLTVVVPAETLEVELERDQHAPPQIRGLLLRRLQEREAAIRAREASGYADSRAEWTARGERLLKKGLSPAHLAAFARELAGPKWGGRNSTKEVFGEDAAALPLLGALIDVICLNRLKLADWHGKFHIVGHEAAWTLGAAQVYGSIFADGDWNYEVKYERQHYKNAPTRRSDPEDEPLVDDLNELPEMRS